jgi:hypothetical protein
MDTICLNEIKTITKQLDGACVSIFMPIQNANGVDPQNLIRFKNLLHKAEEKLISRGLRPTEARSLLQPAEQLITDKPFWNRRSKGLAFYLDTNRYFYYWIPEVVQEMVAVGSRFYVKPLISLLGDCGTFYILVLSQNENRLLQCTANGSVRVDLKGVPRNLAETLNNEVPDSRVQYRSSGAKTAGAESFQVSGSGSLADVNKAYILKYFEEINKVVNQILAQENVPLILAGVDYLHPIYRQANKYPHLLREGIVGNSDLISDDILREQAWVIVKPQFELTRNKAISELNKNAGIGKLAVGEKEVIPASSVGRVRYLFIADGAQKWGKFDTVNNTVNIHSTEEKDDEELIDLAVFNTLKNDGSVFILKPEDIPGGKALSGILRY